MVLARLLLTSLARWELHRKINLRLLLDLAEFGLVVFSIPIAYYLSGNVLHGPQWQWNFSSSFMIFSSIMILCWFVMFRFHNAAKLPRAQRYLYSLLFYSRSYFFVLVVLIASKFIFFLKEVPFLHVFMQVSVSFLITLAFRLLSMHYVRIYRANGYSLRYVLIVGDETAGKFIRILREQKEWGFKISAIVTQSKKLIEEYGSEVPMFPNVGPMKYILDNHVVDEVFYCRKQVDEQEIAQIIDLCNEIGVVFRLQESAGMFDPVRVQFQTLNDKGELSLVDIPSHKISHDIKVFTDIFLSLVALIVLSPLFLLLAIIIKLDSSGPVLFAQERIGLRGRKFKLYKFRTMVVNAEQLLEKLKAQNEMDGPTFKMTHDPRITRIGRFLRKSSLDELPQLFNVIKGEMSLIGPRPPLESEVKEYKRWQLRRLSVKPGISCIWQIMPKRNDIKFDRWMSMDLSYIDNWSLNMDFKLVFQTITTMLKLNGR